MVTVYFLHKIVILFACVLLLMLKVALRVLSILLLILITYGLTKNSPIFGVFCHVMYL